jgi:hypothetical protein
MAKNEVITKNRGEELVQITIPKRHRTDTQRFISVNGERVLVQTGIPVTIKRKFAEVIANGVEADYQAEKYILDNMS